MKKYKLIQDYPESPKIGSIVNSAGIFKIDKKGQKVFDGTKRLKDSHLKYLKDKRYWEEVVEKDYEILSFISTKKHGIEGNILTIKEITEIKNKSNTPECFNLKGYIRNVSGFWNIHSVKRLSDGEVFTVGDKIVFLAEKPYMNHTSSIKSFKIEQNTIYIYNPGCLMGSLKNIKHTKKPLFTTEDGVDIFEGDKFVSLTKDKLLFFDINATAGTNTLKFNPKCFYFSTKEAAEEYIIMNKPCLSINEISSMSTVASTYLKNLKELVKSKL